MKLAEALIKRADLKAQIAQIVTRMKENAKVQEGDTPAEDVVELGRMYESMMEALETLILRINRTNAASTLGDESLADAIARRDCLKAKIAAYRAVRETSLAKERRFSRSEIKDVRTVDIAKLQRIIDDCSRQYRELDTKIQGCNWMTALL